MISKMIYIFILVELVVVGIIDIRSKKISNIWSIFHIALAVVFYFSFDYLFPFSWEIFIFPGIFLLGGFFLFLIEIMGAGDSKYLATFFLLIPIEYQLLFFEKLILSTIIIGLLFFCIKVFRTRKIISAYLINGYWMGIKNIIKSRFSFAPVIFLAWIFLGLEVW